MKIIKLSKLFYETYKDCPEIMKKPDRPYYCLEVVVSGITYAIPFRHHIKHQYSFLTIGNAGIDYTKAVVLSDDSMVSSEPARIETKEWRIINCNEDKIFAGFSKYLRLYKKAQKHSNVPKYSKIIQYSTLQYFDT